MDALRELSAHLGERPKELARLKKEGVKIIGYVPNGYMPEELAYACGAVPVGLLRGGDHEAVAYSGAYLPRFVDTACRAQIGYRMLGDDALYQMVDLMVVPVTDNNIRAIADSWAYYTNVEAYRFGVPHTKDKLGCEYYLGSLHELKGKLEDFTGARVDVDRLGDSIGLFNQMKDLLREISLLRKLDRIAVSGKEFMKLSHASYLADPSILVHLLEAFVQELKQREEPARRPRILLTGSTAAIGDYKVVDIIEETGAAIVIEEFSEGIRPYWERVKANSDALEALADAYFMRRVPPAFFRPSGERIDFIMKLAEDFKVDGLVWYQLMYRDSYDVESVYFERLLRKRLGIPMLKVQSDYDRTEVGPLRTRVETFMETLNRG